MKFKVSLFLLLNAEYNLIKGQDTDHLKGFLLYEDQKEKYCHFGEPCFNGLTLKRKIFETEKKVQDFTVCHRMYLLSYRRLDDSDAQLFFAKTNKFGSKEVPKSSHKLAPGFCNNIFYSTGAANGWFYLTTFNEKLQDVIKDSGIYAIWPEYEENINANQWYSFCFGTDFQKKKAFLVRNGQTVTNFSQPDLWADVNIGIDTSLLEPFKTWVKPVFSDKNKAKSLQSARAVIDTNLFYDSLL